MKTGLIPLNIANKRSICTELIIKGSQVRVLVGPQQEKRYNKKVVALFLLFENIPTNLIPLYEICITKRLSAGEDYITIKFENNAKKM